MEKEYMKNIIFLFSLPRSGSTLLQRILMAHKDIASVAEPWLMLPFCYAFKKEGILTEYGHAACYAAFEDFINNLPYQSKDYYSSLQVFAKSLYEKHCKNDELYFLDKTPRYYNIIPEISEVFPDAKFIFLFRNPVHILASIINTWCNGRIKCLYAYYRDLHEGIHLLSLGYEKLKDKSYAVQYEKFVANPEKYIKEICEYLEIEYDESMMNNFVNSDTKGRMGDPTGVKEYKKISTDSLEKWEKTFNSYYKKLFVIRYIKSLNTEDLLILGYNKEKILTELDLIEIRTFGFKDLFDDVYSKCVRFLKLNILFGKTIKKWTKNRFLD